MSQQNPIDFSVLTLICPISKGPHAMLSKIRPEPIMFKGRKKLTPRARPGARGRQPILLYREAAESGRPLKVARAAPNCFWTSGGPGRGVLRSCFLFLSTHSLIILSAGLRAGSGGASPAQGKCVLYVSADFFFCSTGHSFSNATSGGYFQKIILISTQKKINEQSCPGLDGSARPG